MEDEDDEEDDGPRPTKKAKKAESVKQQVKKVTIPAPVGPNGEPLKRKRGRPRKVPITSEAKGASAPAGESHFSVSPQVPNSSETQPARYLLTAFAFFTFLGNLHSSTDTFTSTHDGTVLNQLPATIAGNIGWWDGHLIRIAQLATSILLLLSLLAPHLPVYLQSLKAVKLLSLSTLVPSYSYPKHARKGKPITSTHTAKKDLGTLSSLFVESLRCITSKLHTDDDALRWKKEAQRLIFNGVSRPVNEFNLLTLHQVPKQRSQRGSMRIWRSLQWQTLLQSEHYWVLPSFLRHLLGNGHYLVTPTTSFGR